MNNTNTNPIYLFISRDCTNCDIFIDELKKNPEIAKNITPVSVETTPNLPPNLTHVPSLLVDGEIIAGKACLEWLKNKNELDPGFLSGKGNSPEYSYITNDSTNNPNNNPGVLGYSFLETSVAQSQQQPQQMQQQHQMQQQMQQQQHPQQMQQQHPQHQMQQQMQQQHPQHQMQQQHPQQMQQQRGGQYIQQSFQRNIPSMSEPGSPNDGLADLERIKQMRDRDENSMKQMQNPGTSY